MNARTVTVTTGSRLHFGMFSFGTPGERQFGGVGVMLDRPALRVRITPRAALRAVGPHADRAESLASRVLQSLGAENQSRLVEVLESPPEHVGFGVGTQLSLAIAAGINASLDRPSLSWAELAELAGRGDRSSIGTYGFDRGGLLVEAGKLPGDRLGPLEARVELPVDWRFVLMRPASGVGLHGAPERQAFESLPPVPLATTQQLRSEVFERLIPAAQLGHFAEFSASLYRFGFAAGSCFAKFQAGAFASETVAAQVAHVRSLGVAGVGQSSWGPSVFALTPNEHAASQLIEQLQPSELFSQTEFIVTGPRNSGADFIRE